jgi:hypothetical protein
MGNGEAETGLGSHLEEEIEEAERIGSPRHGHEDLAAASEEGRPGEGAVKGFQNHLLSNPGHRRCRRKRGRSFARKPTPAAAIRS